MQRHNNYFRSWLTAVLLLYPFVLLAQQELSLSKQAAVALALDNNKSLAAARMTVEQAKARRTQAGRLTNPSLRVDYSTDQAFNNEGEHSFGIGFEQQFPITKRLSLLKEIAEIEIELAQAEIAEQERNLRQEVETAILLIAETIEEIELREAQIILLRRLSEFVQSQVQAGEASNLEVNQVKLELFSVHEEIHELQNEQSDEKGHLRQLMGLEPGTPLKIDYSYIKPKAARQFPSVTKSSLREHPELRKVELLAEIAGSQTTLAMANRWQDISLGLFFKNNKGIDRPVGHRTDNFLGLSLSLPMPIHNNNQGRITERRLQQRQYQLQLEALTLEKRNRAQTLETKMANLFKQIDEYETEVTQLVDENLQDISAAYESGLLSLTDLFRIQEQQLNIEIFQLTLLHDYEQALVDWRATTHLSIQ